MKTKNVSTKIVTGLVLSLAVHAGLTAQNSTSHSANTNAIAGLESCAIGLNTLNSNTTGQFNTAIGRWALTYNTTGSENIAVGGSVLGYNNASGNTGVGYAALAYNTSGSSNVAVGNRSLFNNTTGYNNSGLGNQSLFTNTTGYENCAFGGLSLYANTTGNRNAAFGYYALSANTNGLVNTAVGHEAMSGNTSGSSNTGIGNNALWSNTTGNGNTAVGQMALFENLAGSNTGVGVHALSSNDVGSNNAALGASALQYNNGGSYNTGVGSSAMLNNTGSNNNNNTGLGALTNITALSNYANATAVGYQALVDASDRVWLGNANVANGDVWSYGTYNTLSDGRFKSNVKESDVKGIEFIKLLRPVVYNFEAKKATEFMTKNMSEELRKNYLSEDFSKATAIRQSGFIAQEMAEAAKKSGYDFDGVHLPVDDNDVYGIAYGQLVVPLVKAVQEMDQQKTELEQKVERLERQLQELMNKNGSATGINQPTAIDGFALEQNIPNPFSNETVINYTLPSQVKDASLLIYDLSGKQIASFPLNGQNTSSITLSSEKLAAGIYIYSVMADGKILDSKRMVVAQK